MSIRRRPGTFLWAIVAMGAALLAMSCTQPSPGVTPGGTGPGGVPQGGEFRINMGTEPDTIDPNRSNFSTSILVASQVFEGLLNYDKDLNLTPGVAKEVPSHNNGGISSDGKTYTFKLRNDSKWSDGQTVTAKDFAYAVKRSLDPKLAAPYASSLYDIQGAEAYNEANQAPDDQLKQLRDAVGVKALDDFTLEVKLQSPRPSFLHLISLWVAWPVREDIVTKFGDQWTEPPNYIGNGSFVLTKWAHQERLEFAPNPHYSGAGKPNLAKLVFVQVADANQAYLAYQNSELEAVAVPDANVKLVQADPNLSKETVRYNELVIFGYEFNAKSPPFDNPKVRQALAMAVDRRALIERVSQGIGKVAYSPVPPGMPGHDAEAGKDLDFNVAKAKDLLAQAGFSDPSRFPKVTFTFADTSANRVRAEFFQAQMKQNLGIDFTLEPVDGRAYQQRFNAGQFQMVFGGWGADYPDPDNFVPELFKTGSGNNHTNYSNPKTDEQAEKCQKEQNEQARLAACREAQKLVVQDQPWIFMFYRERFWLLKPYVKGFQVTAKDQLPGNRFYSQVYIQK